MKQTLKEFFGISENSEYTVVDQTNNEYKLYTNNDNYYVLIRKGEACLNNKTHYNDLNDYLEYTKLTLKVITKDISSVIFEVDEYNKFALFHTNSNEYKLMNLCDRNRKNANFITTSNVTYNDFVKLWGNDSLYLDEIMVLCN